MPDPTREDRIAAIKRHWIEAKAEDGFHYWPHRSGSEDIAFLLHELEAGGWPPPILVGRLRADRSTYYICPERPGFHFITGEGESTDALLEAFREFCVLYDAANSAPPATSDGGEG